MSNVCVGSDKGSENMKSKIRRFFTFADFNLALSQGKICNVPINQGKSREIFNSKKSESDHKRASGAKLIRVIEISSQNLSLFSF